MFGSEILEVAIGIVFVYLLTSTICAAIREGIEALLKTRAAYLEHGIRELLHDTEGKGLAKSFYEHPLIYGLFSGKLKPDELEEDKSKNESKEDKSKDSANSKRNQPSTFSWIISSLSWIISSLSWIIARGGNLPSYIPTKNFAVALMDLAARGKNTDAESSNSGSPVISLENIRMNISQLENPAVQRVLLTAIDSAQGDINKAQANIEAWFNSSMDRVSGWYKRSTQWIIFVIALIVVSVLNINTITIVDFLYKNDAERTVIIKKIEANLNSQNNNNSNSSSSSSNINTTTESLDSLNLPIGWTRGWGAPNPHPSMTIWGALPNPKMKIQDAFAAAKADVWNNLLAPILGLLMTAFAATMGAPFWFDVLNKIMVIRSTVKPHEKSPEEASEDRQSAAQPANTVAAQPTNTVIDTAALRALLTVPNNMTVTSPPTQPLDTSLAADNENDVDGCEVAIKDATPDEDLPKTEGGVA